MTPDDLTKLKAEREADRASVVTALDRLPARSENSNHGGDAMQLTPEEREAAERVRRRRNGADVTTDDDYHNATSDSVDNATLADLALRLLAAGDDETLVDESWLRSVFQHAEGRSVSRESKRGRLTVGTSGTERQVYCLWLCGELIWVQGHEDYYKLTRGDVRRLCRALGIPLQETPTP